MKLHFTGGVSADTGSPHSGAHRFILSHVIFGRSTLRVLVFSSDGFQDVLVILDLLDTVRAGIFHAMFMAPQASSQPRVRHVGVEGTASASITSGLHLFCTGRSLR